MERYHFWQRETRGHCIQIAIQPKVSWDGSGIAGVVQVQCTDLCSTAGDSNCDLRTELFPSRLPSAVLQCSSRLRRSSPVHPYSRSLHPPAVQQFFRLHSPLSVSSFLFDLPPGDGREEDNQALEQLQFFRSGLHSSRSADRGFTAVRSCSFITMEAPATKNVVGDREVEADSSSSSSIGRDTDSSGRDSEGDRDSGEGEVQSSYKGPVDTLDTLEEVLPMNSKNKTSGS